MEDLYGIDAVLGDGKTFEAWAEDLEDHFLFWW